MQEAEDNQKLFNITVEQAARRFAERGVPRSTTTISRYCKNGVLECRQFPVNNTSKYFITEQSLERAIVEQIQLKMFEQQASEITHDLSQEPATSHSTLQHATVNHEKSSSAAEAATPAKEDFDEERAEERGSLRTEVARLREERTELREELKRVEGENAAYRMTAQNLPGVLDRVQKLMDENQSLKQDMHTLKLSGESLVADKKKLEEKLALLEAPKEEASKSFFARLLGN